MQHLDRFLNNITTYRLVLYGLMLLSTYAITLGFMGKLEYSGLSLVITLYILLPVGVIVNFLISRVLKVAINVESSFITMFILFFLVVPVTSAQTGVFAAGVAAVAMLSKYILAYNRKHIFNPAAVGVFIFSFLGYGAIWWVATPLLIIPTLVLGLLIVRKIRRFSLLFAFLATSIPVFLAYALYNKISIADSLQQFFLSFPLIFFGTIMLTEPLTLPPRRKLQILYGALIGTLFSLQVKLFFLYPSPEFALLIGNIFSFIVSPKQKFMLVLKNKKEIAQNTYEFVFATQKKIAFKAGQYLEWTLPLFLTDGRGNRRYFTIASSPHEEDIKIGIKLNSPPSSFKKKLKDLETGERITAGQLAGDFTLSSKDNKFIFIAGGIGVTPFRSIIGDLVEKKDPRSIVLFYANKTAGEIAYKEFFDKAETRIDLKVLYGVTDEKESSNWKGLRGRITPEILKKEVPDYKKRIYYLSGPEAMVKGYKKLILSLGISRTSIHTDYFPGF